MNKSLAMPETMRSGPAPVPGSSNVLLAPAGAAS
jgi:hypothetical protein